MLPYQGKTWEFDDSRITASEARTQKRLTGGATPTQASAQRFELDPDALVAALVIARRRAGLSAEDAAVVDADDLELTAVAEATERAAGGNRSEQSEQSEQSERSEADPVSEPDREAAPDLA